MAQFELKTPVNALSFNNTSNIMCVNGYPTGSVHWNIVKTVCYIFQTGGGGGMSSSMVPMSRPGLGGMGMSGGYSGANAMANNGLNPNQNQVKFR